MNDRDLLEDILLTVKGACDLYMHGTIESPTPNIHNTFNTALCDTLKMQSDIYNKMASKGWYPTEQAEQPKIDKVKQTYSVQ